MRLFGLNLILLLFLVTVAVAGTIAITGTEEVGKALGPEFAMQGHDIVCGGQTGERWT